MIAKIRKKKTRCGNKKIMFQAYHWVDRTNQCQAYYNSETRSVRKQNRVLDYMIEMYTLMNGHTLWLNARNLVKHDRGSTAGFRIQVNFFLYRATTSFKKTLYFFVCKKCDFEIHLNRLAK